MEAFVVDDKRIAEGMRKESIRVETKARACKRNS